MARPLHPRQDHQRCGAPGARRGAPGPIFIGSAGYSNGRGLRVRGVKAAEVGSVGPGRRRRSTHSGAPWRKQPHPFRIYHPTVHKKRDRSLPWAPPPPEVRMQCPSDPCPADLGPNRSVWARAHPMHRARCRAGSPGHSPLCLGTMQLRAGLIRPGLLGRRWLGRLRSLSRSFGRRGTLLARVPQASALIASARRGAHHQAENFGAGTTPPAEKRPPLPPTAIGGH